jgi:hypothetical protein
MELAASEALQNQSAEVASLSAIQWAQVLKKLDCRSRDVAITRYNDIVRDDPGNARASALSEGRVRLVNNLMERCDPNVFHLILDHLDDSPRAAFNETDLRSPVLWLGSVARESKALRRDDARSTGAAVELVSRPLTPVGQCRLFSRIIQDT